MKPTPSDFMSAAPAMPGGNTPWASRYCREIKSVAVRYAAHSPRTLQKSLGPSELGEECDRQVVGKMAAEHKTNNVLDPWPSIVGTAVHAWLEEAFKWDNDQLGYIRWIPEMRVTPDPGADSHPGTADLYDTILMSVDDHKVQGETTAAKIRAGKIPRKYFIQLLLYGRGYRNLGFPVQRVVLISWPRTKSTLDDLYVWEHLITPEDDKLVDDILARTQIRQQLAEEIRAGRMNLMQIPPEPSDESCIWCPFYRPQAAYDPDVSGCPGTMLLNRGGRQ